MLTELRIKSLKPRAKVYKVSVGKGLQLWVNPGGSKVWRFRWRRPDEAGKLTKEQSITLGDWPTMPLEAATKAALELKALCREGVDPAEDRQRKRTEAAAAMMNTLEKVSDLWWEEHFQGKETSLHAQQVKRDLARDIMPFIGKKPVAGVDGEMVKACLDRIVDRGGKSRANRLLTVLSMIFRWSMEKQLTAKNPTAALKKAFKAPKAKHFPAATNPVRLGEILVAVDAYPEMMTRCALQLASLLIARPGEIAGMRWVDIDLTARTWLRVVSKVHHELVTPLPDQAVRILERVRNQSGHLEWVFPGRDSAHMNKSTLNYALKRIGIVDHVAHGYRAAARTILDEKLGFRPDIIEHQLGHSMKMPNGTAYARMQFIDLRKAMLQRWADFLDGCRTDAAAGGKNR